MTDALRVYCYGPCSTCRRALAWLSQRGVVAEVIEITTTPPPVSLLRQALAQFGDRRRLFNTSGKSYREIGAARLKAMDDEEALAALASQPQLRSDLIRRGLVRAAGYSWQRTGAATRELLAKG